MALLLVIIYVESVIWLSARVESQSTVQPKIIPKYSGSSLLFFQPNDENYSPGCHGLS